MNNFNKDSALLFKEKQESLNDVCILFIHSCIHGPSINSFIHTCIYSFIHSHSFIRSFIRLFNYLFIHLLLIFIFDCNGFLRRKSTALLHFFNHRLLKVILIKQIIFRGWKENQTKLSISEKKSSLSSFSTKRNELYYLKTKITICNSALK